MWAISGLAVINRMTEGELNWEGLLRTTVNGRCATRSGGDGLRGLEKADTQLKTRKGYPRHGALVFIWDPRTNCSLCPIPLKN